MGRRKGKQQKESYTDTGYIITDGIRHVRPYIFAFHTYAKARWLGRSIYDIFVTEFGGQAPEYYALAIASGRITANEKHIDVDYIVRDGDLICHKVHRHEPPVQGEIEILGRENGLVCVNKPSSMPMHPCGAYRYNSLFVVLAKEFGLNNLHLVHRLDRLTSGLVVVAESSQRASEIAEQMRTRQTKKTYLARVKGRFPSAKLHELPVLPTECHDSKRRRISDNNCTAQSEPAHATCEGNEQNLRHKQPDQAGSKQEESKIALNGEGNDGGEEGEEEVEFVGLTRVGYSVDDKGNVTVRHPLKVVSYKDGIHECNEEGKFAETRISSLWYDDSTDTSLVECKPITGRTHQIRLHLQLIGNPIANDPCYGGEMYFDDPKRKEAASEAHQRLQHLGLKPLSKTPHIVDINSNEPDAADNHPNTNTIVDAPQADEESELDFMIRTCRYCQQGDDALEFESVMHCTCIWLHALKYEGPDWAFEAPFPSWASL